MGLYSKDVKSHGFARYFYYLVHDVPTGTAVPAQFTWLVAIPFLLALAVIALVFVGTIVFLYNKSRGTPVVYQVDSPATMTIIIMGTITTGMSMAAITTTIPIPKIKNREPLTAGA